MSGRLLAGGEFERAFARGLLLLGEDKTGLGLGDRPRWTLARAGAGAGRGRAEESAAR